MYWGSLPQCKEGEWAGRGLRVELTRPAIWPALPLTVFRGLLADPKYLGKKVSTCYLSYSQDELED